MRCAVLAVAGRPTPWVATATDAYLKRLPRSWHARVELLAPSRKQTADARRDDEWQRLSDKLDAGALKIVLDERGKSLESRGLAARMGDWQGDGRTLAFVLGGPDGFSAAARAEADLVLSLSAMTMPHELARVVLVEQLYRAHTILEGHPYHRD